jgi:uncharacterized FAD-dependent dehydrogenase
MWPRGTADVERLRKPALNPESNVSFGAGAGPFSDGKLTTRIQRPAHE